MSMHQDADSLDKKGKKSEGAFYLWTEEEVDSALGKGSDAAELFKLHYYVKANGNTDLSPRRCDLFTTASCQNLGGSARRMSDMRHSASLCFAFAVCLWAGKCSGREGTSRNQMLSCAYCAVDLILSREEALGGGFVR